MICTCLGTFITEFGDGEKICRQFLTSKSSIDLIVDKLVDVALAHGFDGWLLNIENLVDVSKKN